MVIKAFEIKTNSLFYLLNLKNRLHPVPTQLAEPEPQSPGASHRLQNMISDGLNASSQNLSFVTNTVGEKTVNASKLVKNFAKTSWKTGKTEVLKAGSEIKNKTAPVIKNVRNQMRNSSSSESNRTSPQIQFHSAIAIADHPDFFNGEKLAVVNIFSKSFSYYCRWRYFSFAFF
jgi:hypothetical protein